MKTLINKIKLLSNDQNPESIKLLIDSLTELGDLKLAKSPKSIEQYTDAAIFYQHAFVISTRYLKDSVPEVSKKLQQVNGAVGKLLNIEELLLETESYKKILKELRDFVKKKIDNIEFDNLDPDVIKDLFHNISTKMRENIVAKLFKSSEGEIGTAPCKYSVIGLGSLAL